MKKLRRSVFEPTPIQDLNLETLVQGRRGTVGFDPALL